VLTNLVNNTEGVRFGLMRFGANTSMGAGGGKIVAPIGSTVSTITTAISNLTTSGYTPLGETLRDAGKYYKGQGDYYGDYATSPIQYDCQPNFVLLVSDGLQNGNLDIRTEATNRKTQDHATSMPGTQNVLVHTVGFAVSADERDAANDVLQTAAANGGGTFYETDNEAQLEAALQDAIRQIMAATFSFATPVIPTTSTTGSTKAYLAAFQSDPSKPAWRGYLKAYQRDSTGNVPVDANGVPLDSALVWEAGAKLNTKAAADRTIKAIVGGSLQDFNTSNTNITAAMLGVTTSADRDKVINFIRGIDTIDEDLDGDRTEQRAWKLGDIFHSTPVLVTPPLGISTDPSYSDFQTANASRTSILLAGANDGMLHAFRESDGEELWAFIPGDQLGRLKLLTDPHEEHPFYLDSSPIVADVKTGGTWKTVVIVGERRGGAYYHALDITNPSNPTYLWSFTDARIAETWSEPVIGKVKVGGADTWVAFIGGGYDTANNNSHGKAVMAIDIASGTKLWEYYNTGSNDNQYMNFSIPTNVTAVDLDLDGYVNRLYVGDVGGQVWKFDVSADGTVSSGLVTNWTGKRLFTAPLTGTNPPAAGEYYGANPIYGAIVPTYDEEKNVWIFFGTGDRNHPNNAGANRFYGLKDNTTITNGSALTEANLVDITTTNATVTQGWYIRLASTEKALTSADVFNKFVYFSTFTPTTVTACGTGGGTAKLYAVQMLTGYAALDWANNASVLTTTSASATRAKEIGTGIPSKPIIVLTESGVTITTSVVAATTSNQLPSNPAPPPSNMRKILYWTERY
jgi:type IV pilus assembly protein PilY1